MQKFHLKLTQKYPRYNSWHQTKHHNKIHWGVFLLYTFLIFSFLVNPLRFSMESSRTLAQVKTVPLTLDTADASVSQYPVSSGIPFPRGELFSTDNLRILNSQGQEIPMQAHSLVSWPDGSVKSALVQFEADVSQTETKTFNLEYGTGVKRKVSHSTPIKVVQDPQVITIDTGKTKLEFSKSSFTLFNQVWIDQNNNQSYEDSEKTLSNPGDIFFVNAFDNKEYKASLYQSPTYTIEEQGPIRAVVKAEGKLQNQDGGQLTDFKVWIYAYAGKEQIQVDYTLVDSRIEWDVEHPTNPLKATTYGLKLPLNFSSSVYSFGGENEQVYTGQVTGEHYLFQHGKMNHRDGGFYGFDFTYEGVGAGKKAPGWMDMSDNTFGVSAMVKNFWQQFPKELAVKDNAMFIYLHPQRAYSLNLNPTSDPIRYVPSSNTSFYAPREGMAKTYQILFNFHKGQKEEADPDFLNKIYQANYPLVTAPASWYAKSKAFGNIIEAGPWSQGYDERLISEIYQRSVAECRENGCLTFQYGWRDFGDRMRPGWILVSPEGLKVPGWYNDTHVGSTNFFIQYLRTKDKRWWELGENGSRHWMDIDVSHAQNRYGYGNRAFGPGEAHMIKHEMGDHDDKALHSGHAHISGLPDYYLLTGDKRAFEVIKEVGDWFANAWPYSPDFSEGGFSRPEDHWAEAERDYGWPIFVTNEVFRATGDPKYLKTSAQQVKHLINWWQTPSDHWVNGEIVGKNDWTKGTGWWYMFPRQDNSPWPNEWQQGKFLYNGTNPWMAGSLISPVIKFYEYNKDYNYVKNSLIKEMLLQTMNYVVKYGWEESRQWRNYDYFVYSEAARATDGGGNHLYFPLAYLWTLYQEGGLEHPEWYDTVPKWIKIVSDVYKSAKTFGYSGSTSLGFYGYEMIFPPDFFAIMKDLEDKQVLPDTESPGKINDLTIEQIKSTSVILTWTATGDDSSSSGQATKYDIRYSTSLITSGNFSQAVSVTETLTPKAAGSKESITISNLEALTTYYFAIKAIDEQNNIGEISNIATAATPELDLISPAQITDLEVSEATFKTAALTWTATGDDNNEGNAISYDLRYSTSAITDDNFSQLSKIKTGVSGSSGTKESAGLFGLSPNTTYYFAIKAIDNVGNVSRLSNIAVKTLPPAPEGLITEVFQEGNQGYQGTQDTFIFENSPSTKFGSEGYLVAGEYTDYGGYNGTALFKFDLSTIPANVDIKEAHLELYLAENSRNATQKLFLYHLKQPWQEREANWYQYDIGKAWEASGAKGRADRNDTPEDPNGLLIGDLNKPNIWKKFNLSPQTVKQWINKSLSNEGVAITGGKEGPGYTSFTFITKETADSSLRPKLVITYEYVDQPVGDAPPQFKSSDLNQDTKVDSLDFDILKQDFNRTDKPAADLNQDGIVDSRDLGIMMSEWNK